MLIRRALAPLLIAALAVSACGDDDDDGSGSSVPTGTDAPDTSDGGGGSITVGSADFPESQLLAQIYGQALAAANFDVSYELAIGSREVYYQAIADGEVDLVPEYTNSLLSFVLRQADPEALPSAANVDEQVSALQEALPETLTVLTPSTAEDKDVIVCTKEVADANSLTNLSGLAAVAGDIKLGAPPEFEDRSPFGLVGFEEIYGAVFGEFVPLEIGAIADSLKAGAIDCGNMFSTMSVITTEGFVALEDDKTIVPNEAVLPLVRADAATPALTSALDSVNVMLTTEELKAMMVKVEVDKLGPDVVAKDWLATL